MKTLTSERDNLSKQLESVNDQIAQLADQEAQKRLEAQRKEVLKESQDQREAGLLSQLEAAKQVEAQQKAAKELTAARQAGLEKEQSATFKFHESEAKAEQKFSADLAKLEGERNKIAEDAAKEREAIERKATSDILQAQQDRDVVAAERAKKQKDADLRGVDEEALAKQAENSQKLDELRNQFTAERQERQAAFQLQIQQIQTEAQERVRAAQQSGQQTLSQVAVLEKQLADLRAQFAKENTELQAQFEQEAQVKRLQALQGRAQELQAQIKLINGVLTGNLQVLAGNAAIALINGFSEQARRLLTGLLGSVNAPRVREQAAIPNRRAITAYAEGGVTPTGLFAANREEIFSTDTRLAVLNRDTSKALLAGLQAGQRGAGASVIVNLGGIHNPNLGGVATPADVQAMGEGVLGVVVEGLKQHQLLVQKGSVA